MHWLIGFAIVISIGEDEDYFVHDWGSELGITHKGPRRIPSTPRYTVASCAWCPIVLSFRVCSNSVHQLGASTRCVNSVCQLSASPPCVNSLRQHPSCVNWVRHPLLCGSSLRQLGASTRCIISVHQLGAPAQCVSSMHQLCASSRLVRHLGTSTGSI